LNKEGFKKLLKTEIRNWWEKVQTLWGNSHRRSQNIPKNSGLISSAKAKGKHREKICQRATFEKKEKLVEVNTTCVEGNLKEKV